MKNLVEHCHAYKGSDIRRSVGQLATTALLFVAALAAMAAALYHGIYWAYALLLLPTAGLIIRLFIVQHDCGHGSFFTSRRANDMTGRLISLFTFLPYDFWRRSHNMHHASSGNIDRRGAGGIDTLTVKEYNALSKKNRFLYRLYRNPLILLLFGPPVYILLLQRLPPAQSVPFLENYHPVPTSLAWQSAMLLNLSLVVFYGALMTAFGWKLVVLTYLPLLLSAFWVGQWLFFVQHQFEDAYWKNNEDWRFSEAAFQGSSYYVLPRILQWFTGNIGFHHIHHLCPSIPNYNLQKCCETNKTLNDSRRITLRQSLQCVRFSLWDEEQSRMIGFRDLRKG